MRPRAALPVIALCALLPACGGGHSGSSSLIPPSAPGHPVAQNEPVKFTFTIPKKTVSAARHAETISPSTQSIGVTVNSGTQQVFNATPTSAGCSVTERGTTCTVTIDAAVGADSFDVNTYSGINATGAILDHTSFNYTIVQDTTNTLNIVLGPVVSTTADSGPGSLRQAVSDANPGDTITFLLSMPATITLTSGSITLLRNVTISGPAGTAPSGGRRVKLPAATVTISGGNNSRVFGVASGITATISNLTVTQGSTASGNGGALDDSGTLTLDEDQITGSSASGTGGAVAVEANGALTVTSTTMSGNRAPQGGAVWADASARLLTITGSTLSNNTSTNSANQGNGGAIFTNASATLTSDTVSNNNGSAVVAMGSAALTISGGTYSANTAKGGHGGALYLSGGVTTIGSNAVFDGNAAGDPTIVSSPPPAYGGAIYNSSSDLTIDSTAFSYNTAGSGTGAQGYGGAIELDDGNLTVTNSTFTSNGAGRTDALLGEGGAIFDHTYNQMTVKTSTFTSNTAGGTSGGYGGALELQGQLALDHDTFTSNSAYGSSDGDAYGGAADVVPTMSGESFTNSGFTGNSATGGNTTSGSNGAAYGGGLELDGSETLTLDGDTFGSNSVTGENDAEGGGLDAASGIAMTGGSFDGNTATVGNAGCNAVALGGGATLASGAALSNVTFTNNKAVTTSARSTGSCVALARPRASVRLHARTRFVRHPHYVHYGVTSQEYALGGALEYCSCGTTLTLDHATITGNSATTDGGGVDLRGGTATITDTTISSNSVTATPNTDDGGGGVMIADSVSTTIADSTIANNTVSGDMSGNDGGGGVFVSPVSNSTPAVSLTNDTVTGNSAQYGGGIYNEFSTVTLTNVTLVNGIADAASGAGGNYYGQSTNTLTIFGTIVAGGSASTQSNLGGDTTNTLLVDNGYNIINTSNSSMNGASDFDVSGPAVDPLLSALASNGGPTQTMADSTSSPGYDRIPLATCAANGVTTDQRGNARGDSSDDKCDSGAYEYP